ncbi:MAG: toxin-antitoxin system YwqK family antitoxin, partial [Planctomycetota bacterium]
SHNHPDLHFEFNEAWVLQRPQKPDQVVSEFGVDIRTDTVKKYNEKYPNGKPRVTWSAGIGSDGHYLLHGTETWYYENGQKQWQARYQAGDRTGTEIYWSSDGEKRWQKIYRDDGTYRWTIYDADGKTKAESTWQGKKLSSHKIHR